ncbi:uncharacterized protein B0H18DRAFT_148066 [Fomitopsis serialis]|uniref:uncharacterized protein n=1 Tax=Fomitopsis serialis TaxID=139415 RepID=UPI002007A18B|nr:uncharacterized protein B0H18DRAFT_148066 [Neoantrodia serialis]KAH9930332.1 hypothetical protein B0H18DRAFT_148066 [Neoantrodia serialis]
MMRVAHPPRLLPPCFLDWSSHYRESARRYRIREGALELTRRVCNPQQARGDVSRGGPAGARARSRYDSRGPRRWAWFVYMAVERFRRWVKCVTANKDVDAWVETEIPPLDVLMVWHAYMLNPTWYAEDCLRVPALYSLHALNDRLLRAVIAMGDPAQYQPSEKRRDAWLSETGTPFDPMESLKHLTEHDVTCPKCGTANAAPYLTTEGAGYAQQGFKLACNDCRLTIDKPALALDNFVGDLIKNHNDPEAKLDTYLSGTLRSPTDVIMTKRTKVIKERIVQYDKLRRPNGYTPDQWRFKIKEDFGYSINNLRDAARGAAASMGVMKRMLDRILSAYIDDSQFSIDLVGAVVRQGSFTNKMHAFGWTAPGYFETLVDEVVLVHAITRYHAFLDMMTQSPTSLFVPTLDIDLVWHTHQLMASKYSNDCKQFVGWHIDHDDKVEENRLANAFDITCQAWQKHFKVPYTYCGCPLPGDSIGDKLQRLTRKFVSSQHSEQPLNLDPPAHPDIPPATHASEHNAVQVYLNAALDSGRAAELHRQRVLRQQKMNYRRERDARRAQKGDIDPELLKRGQNHYAAFLTPVPFIQPISACVPVGGQPQCSAGAGTCAAGVCSSAGWYNGSVCANADGGSASPSVFGGGARGNFSLCSAGGEPISSERAQSLGDAVNGIFSLSLSSNCGGGGGGSTCGGGGGSSSCGGGGGGSSSGCGGGGS